MIRNHITWSKELEQSFKNNPKFDVITTSPFGMFTFCLSGGTEKDSENTKKLLNLINADGECYLTQTIIDKNFVIRVSIGTFETTREDVMAVHKIANKFYNIAVKR